MKLILAVLLTLTSFQANANGLKECNAISDLYASVAYMRNLHVKQTNVYKELVSFGVNNVNESTANTIANTVYEQLPELTPEDIKSFTFNLCIKQ